MLHCMILLKLSVIYFNYELYDISINPCFLLLRKNYNSTRKVSH